MERGYSVNYVPATLLSAIELIKGKQLGMYRYSSIGIGGISLFFKVLASSIS